MPLLTSMPTNRLFRRIPTSFSRFLIPVALLITLFLTAIAHAQTGGYMASRPNALVYLRITRTGNTLKGYLQQVFTNYNVPDGFSIRRDDILGTSADSAVMLKIGSFLGQGTHELDGDFRGGKLHLTYPAPNGQIVKLTFAPVSAEKWNAALSAFQHQQMATMNMLRRTWAANRQQQAVAQRRTQLIQDFTRAVTTLNEAAPALIKWEEKLELAQAAVMTTEAAHEAAKRVHVDAKQAYETKKQDYQATKSQRTADENEREYAALEREYDQVGKVYDLITPAYEKWTNAKQALSEAKSAYNQDWAIFLRAGQQVLQARREIGKLGPLPIEFHAEAGMDASPANSDLNVYRRFMDGHTTLLTTFPKDTPFTIAVADGDWYALILNEKQLGWVKASDVKVMRGIGAPAATGRSPRRQ